MPALKSLQGLKYGRWTVVKYRGERQWECRCDCGTVKSVNGQHLTRGSSASCGCLRSELLTKHGKMSLPEYNVWRGIVQRCAGNSPASRNYKPRGIEVCRRWASSFQAFLDDMGLRPTASHTIERINNDGNYEPGNCRWATMSEQHRNTRRSHFITVHGEKMCVQDAATRYGVHPSTLLRRLQKGMDETEAATAPVVGRAA